MSNGLYYGEIVAKISYHLYQNPEHKAQITEVMGRDNENEDKFHTLCADAARVFDAALGILKLIDEGKLNLNDQVKEVAPELPVDNEWEIEFPEGVVLVCFLKTRLNEDLLLKPTSRAIARSV